MSDQDKTVLSLSCKGKEKSMEDKFRGEEDERGELINRFFKISPYNMGSQDYVYF